MKHLGLIFRLARFHFLVLGFMLYLMGYFLALLGGVECDFAKFFFGYLILGTAHLSVSFSNDYFDSHSDRYSVKTAFSGGSKVLVEHPELESLALKLAVLLLSFSIISSAFFTIIYVYPFSFFIFGLLGGLVGWFYSAPPLKLAYRGLGELTLILAVGFLIPGMGYFVASGTLGPIFQAFVFPLCCYGLFFIINVELPDVESDAIGQKKNILVKWGRNLAKYISALTTFAGTISMILLLFLEINANVLDLKPFVVFSFLPLIASINGLFLKNCNQRLLVRQVVINIASMVLFLVIIDASLFFQYIS
ncbi:MAG: prenyltransferase [Candidatus Hodarchaeota archaeon]